MYLTKLNNIRYCVDRLIWEKDLPSKFRDRIEFIQKEIMEMFDEGLRDYKQE